MEDTPNKTLVFLLIATIVVSIASTMISINRVNQLRLQLPRVIGLATTTTGVVNISIANVNSISIFDTQINFGSCQPNSTYGSNLSSNISNDTTWQSWGSPGVCTGIVNSPDNITIRNDGNSNMNVSVKTNSLASTFIGGSMGGAGQAEMWFSVRNASDYPGCYNASTTIVDSGVTPTGLQWDWKNFSVVNTNYLACANLTPTENYNSIYVYAKIFLPADAPTKTGANTTLTFTATNW